MPKANSERVCVEGFLWKSPERMCLPRSSLFGKRETAEILCGEDVPALGPGCAAARCATSSPRPALGVTSPWPLELGHSGCSCIMKVSKCYKPGFTFSGEREGKHFSALQRLIPEIYAVG